MESQAKYDNLNVNRELIQLSMKFAKLSTQKQKALQVLAEKDYITNKEIANLVGCNANTVGSVLNKLRNEGWIDSESHGRNAYWFFNDPNVKTFILWNYLES
jgi:transcription initiation factor IIE alpha subunit